MRRFAGPFHFKQHIRRFEGCRASPFANLRARLIARSTGSSETWGQCASHFNAREFPGIRMPMAPVLVSMVASEPAAHRAAASAAAVLAKAAWVSASRTRAPAAAATITAIVRAGSLEFACRRGILNAYRVEHSSEGSEV